jgi:polysulfide reductase-like protein
MMSDTAPGATRETGYYGLPLLKKPVWTWEVPLYFFVGGAAGAASIVAVMAEWADGDASLVRDAEWMAVAGGAMSAGLLTADLGRPERFLNMLRVFKLQSAMSVGSWTLTAFSSLSGASAFAAAMDRKLGGSMPVRLVHDVAAPAAALLGTVMSTYTGVLIGATAIPVWNRNVRLLPLHFGASGMASAVAILELLGHDDRALQRLGIAAAAIETATGVIIEMRGSEAMSPLRHGISGALTRAGGVLSGPVPLICRALAERHGRFRRVAGLSALAGSVITRLAWIAAGRASAHDPRVPLALPAAESSAIGTSASAASPPMRNERSAIA